MYIEQIPTVPDISLKLSCFNPENKATLDFDAILLTDPMLKAKLDSFIRKKGITHYIIVKNIIYDKKKIDFSSKTIESTLYANMKNGKTYRWAKVGVSFLKIGSDNYATCILSKLNATPYNRRETFRLPVDQEGLVYWEDDSMADNCIIKDISHDGIGLLLNQSSRKLLRGMSAKITWDETAHFDNSDKATTKSFTVIADIVRRKNTLEGETVIGLKMKEEPDPIKDYIQWAQVHRGFSLPAQKSTNEPKGVKKQENWELEKQLEQMQ